MQPLIVGVTPVARKYELRPNEIALAYLTVSTYEKLLSLPRVVPIIYPGRRIVR